MQPDSKKRHPEFDARVVAYMPMLRRTAARFGGDRDDLVQETVAHALTQWQSFRVDANRAEPYGHGSGFHNWLYWQMRTVVFNRKTYREAVECEQVVSPSQENIVYAKQVLDSIEPKHRTMMEMIALGHTRADIGAATGRHHQCVTDSVRRVRAKLVKSTGEKVAA